MLRIVLSFFLLSSLAQAEDAKKGLYNQSELGYVVTGGNSASETTSFKQKSEYFWDHDVLSINGHYIQASGLVNQGTDEEDTQTTAENWSATLRYDRVITPKWFKMFVGYGMRGDRFQGVSEGQDIDVGATYYTANSKTYTQFFQLGYRYTRELLTIDPRVNPDNLGKSIDEICVGVGNCHHPEFHYFRLKGSIEYAHSKTLTLGAWVEYLPSVTDFADDQRINYSPYIQSVLTDIFSLKVAYEGRYRSKPAVQGNELTDFTFTTSLLANF